MSPDDGNNSTQVTDEVLLRYLATSPADRRLNDLSADLKSPGRSTGCPEAARMIGLVMGTAPANEAETLLDHAASCDACGEWLENSVQVLSGAPSPEEIAAIAELASQKDWQREIAQKLAATPTSRKYLAFTVPHRDRNREKVLKIAWWAGGAVAAGLTAAVCLFAWQMYRNAPERQLAQAYTAARTLELRVPGAKYVGISGSGQVRGAAEDREPAPLLDARARLARELERSPQNEHWLQLQARADVLAERYGPAVSQLDRLLAEGPVTAELLTDAASAYYQRGLVTGSQSDRSTALDYLRRADGIAPTDPVVLFNEAIVMEDRGQMMNAVEVWNRYVTVERDPQWKAEGQRKLAALEQTLNRLKSHESRLLQMLATPQTMNALAADSQRLASWDEELTSIELDKLIPRAFPGPQADKGGQPQTRGSPCSDDCLAARTLLKALGTSLEQQHHDFWLSDLLPSGIYSLSQNDADNFAEAMRLLAQATRENQTGLPVRGADLAMQSRALFDRLPAAEQRGGALATAFRVGKVRAGLEHMFGLQRSVNFRACRDYAGEMQPLRTGESPRYPWMAAVEGIIEKVCDDTAGTRTRSEALRTHSERIATDAHYEWLMSRIRVREADDAQDSGDQEAAERISISVMRALEAEDPPLGRIANTASTLPLPEEESGRSWAAEAAYRENYGWWMAAGDSVLARSVLLSLAREELRTGRWSEYSRNLQLVDRQLEQGSPWDRQQEMLADDYILLANAMLERGDAESAGRYLDAVSSRVGSYSEIWGLRTYSAALGLLQLQKGNASGATTMLENQIVASEGSGSTQGVADQQAEYARLDHDLYSELAAAWLAEGRAPEQVLALWERFRMRSRGLPVTACSSGQLDCDLRALTAARQALGKDVLVGQVVLLDRVLVYRVDHESVRWSQHPVRRQDLLNSAATLKRMASSRYSTLDFTERISRTLSEEVLPQLPSNGTEEATLRIEADPLLEDLPWTLLPSPRGALGLTYPLAESRSMLATAEARTGDRFGDQAGGARSLVIGASVASAGEPPLPEAIEEAREVSRLVHAPELLLGAQATTSHVAQEIGSATVFHFAGHAVGNYGGTELLLASGSSHETSPWIDGAFLREYPLRSCRLAVLSACSTGQRDVSWNHPLQDMVETMSAQGVPEVVATRWEIDSRATVPFMDNFYGALGQGKDAAVALFTARRLQSQQPQNNFPYYWAAFYVTETKTSGKERVRHASKQR